MDWRAHVRRQLPPLSVPAERELEIVEGLAQQLEAPYDRARATGESDAEARQGASGESSEQ